MWHLRRAAFTFLAQNKRKSSAYSGLARSALIMSRSHFTSANYYKREGNDVEGAMETLKKANAVCFGASRPAAAILRV